MALHLFGLPLDAVLQLVAEFISAVLKHKHTWLATAVLYKLTGPWINDSPHEEIRLQDHPVVDAVQLPFTAAWVVYADKFVLYTTLINDTNTNKKNLLKKLKSTARIVSFLHNN